MNEIRIECALKALAQNVPHPPDRTVEKMIENIRMLENKRGLSTEKDTPAPTRANTYSRSDIKNTIKK